MLISQTLSPIVTPGLREALLFGGERADWERIFDTAAGFRHDDAVLRVLDSEARREEHRREQERKLIWCAPAPAAASVGRPHIFRACFLKDIGGASGVSDSWFDASLYAVDGVTGKTQSLIDYIDNTHLLTQASSPSQSAVPSANAAVASALTLPFAGAAYYASNRAASFWRHVHDCTGLEAFIVCVPRNGTQSVMNTYNSNSTSGSSLFTFVVSAGTGTINCDVYGTSGAVVAAGGLGTLTVGTGTYLHHTILSGTNATVLRQKSVSLTTRTPVTPTQADGLQTLTLGRFASLGNTYLTSEVRAVYMLRGARSAAVHTIIRSFIQKDTGIAP